jgi:hypothetical protein
LAKAGHECGGIVVNRLVFVLRSILIVILNAVKNLLFRSTEKQQIPREKLLGMTVKG